ncbi:hypothetical protein [Streptomyces telluris]|uniref:Uncharacterized protein n=1 Tax=Streptomyces telluris TaxID=2720021 RepID=A0A9X2LI54_9ACTN|nr:hypothetical protein [Streptomyces telluris]MCQ8771608.1 hypothetical protein [Streptomyces telluris]
MAARKDVLLARFAKLPVAWKIVVIAGLAVCGYFSAKFILAVIFGLLMTAFAIAAILFMPFLLIGGLAGGGRSGRRKSARRSYEKWCEENDGRGRYHSDSGVPF